MKIIAKDTIHRLKKIGTVIRFRTVIPISEYDESVK